MTGAPAAGVAKKARGQGGGPEQPAGIRVPDERHPVQVADLALAPVRRLVAGVIDGIAWSRVVVRMLIIEAPRQ